MVEQKRVAEAVMAWSQKRVIVQILNCILQQKTKFEINFSPIGKPMQAVIGLNFFRTIDVQYGSLLDSI